MREEGRIAHPQLVRILSTSFVGEGTGLIPIPGAKGKRFTSRAVTFFELRDGLIARSSDYYDTGAVIDQLGITAELLAGIGRVFGPHWRKPEGDERG